MNLGAAEAGPLWAVTSYFNPVGYRRRRLNYRTFREQLAAPLVTVELSFNGRFELEPQDAEILIQIRGQDVMWQKERLLNIAVEALPASCTQVVILDCDVVFVRPDWMAALSRRLEGTPLAQPFSTIHYASPDVPFGSPEALAGSYCRPSVAYLIEQGNSGRECLVNFTGRGPGTRCTGHAIAARRELLRAHGIYDAHIIGGGDNAFLAAALGAFHEGLAHQNLNDEQIAYYMNWATPFQRDVRGEIACVQGDLVHLWHGEISDRRTIERHHEFAAFGFNPANDIALEPCGCWRWSSDKPAMHDYMRCYFASRMEDGREPSAPGRSAVPPRHSRRQSGASRRSPSMNAGVFQSSPLWAVTSYFNPVGYRRRRQNYRTFREQLAAPLVTVELSFNGRFELEPQDAEILIQIRGRDVMWQKERLLNVAVEALPACCTQVAILDCDVVFLRPDWIEALSRRLEDLPFVQPFSTVHYTPPDVPLESVRGSAGYATRPGVCHLVEQGQPVRSILGHFTGRGQGVPSPGHALAARRELLQTHGLYDAAIVGGGDGLALAAALGVFDLLIQRHVMNHTQAAYYSEWAERFQRAAGGEAGCIPGDLVHLWHGSMDDRRSPQRYHDLRTFEFNPLEDIELDASGCWRWSSNKPQMHAFVRDYFASRNEDGGERAQPLGPAVLQRAA